MAPINPQERVKHSGDQHRSSVVGFVQLIEFGATKWWLRLPLPILEPADRVAQRSMTPRRLTELDGKLSKKILPLKVATSASDLLPQRFRNGEVLEERDNVGECLMKGEDIAVRGLTEPAMQAIEKEV